MAVTETLSHRHSSSGQRGPSRLLRLQSDERLVAQTRRGNDAAYETLVARYQARLLAFCANMLRSREDAEDVLQEVFAAAYGAMVADDRPLNVRPWLYRIARNRSLNHLRRQTAIGVDSMDVHLADGGVSTAERAIEREEFRALLGDVHALAEQQRAALLLREIEGLSYDQIAEVLETTIPAVKSLLVRARVGLAEAAEARRLTCDEVRLELGEWAEGLQKLSPPVRRHVKDCERCAAFKAQLKNNNKVLAALFPLGPILLLQKLIAGHAIGHATGLGAGAGAGASVGTGAAATGGGGSLFTIGLTAGAGKAVATVATVAIVASGAAEVEQIVKPAKHHIAPAAVASVRSTGSSYTHLQPAPAAVVRAPTASAPPQEQQPVTVRAAAATTTPASTTPTVATPPVAPTPTTTAAAPVLVTSTEPVSTVQVPGGVIVEPQYVSTTSTTVQVQPAAPGLGPVPAAGLGPAPAVVPDPAETVDGPVGTPGTTTPTTPAPEPAPALPVTPTTPVVSPVAPPPGTSPYPAP